MMLFEIMIQYPDKSAQFAAELAAGTKISKAARLQIREELAGILTRRNEMQALPQRPELSPDLAEMAGTLYADNCRALDAVFIELCRALEGVGFTLTGGEISALKRQGMPEHLAAELDTLRRAINTTIPAAQRLTADDAATLYYELTRQGLISGALATFGYYLAQLSTPKPKRPESGLKWNGTAAQFAYFVQRFKSYTEAKLKTTIQSPAKALCLAFGFDERQRLNVIKPYLSKAREIKRKATKKSRAGIDAAFNALESLTNK